MTNTSEKEFVSVGELAKILDVSHQYVSQRIEDGTLKMLPNGRLRLAESLEAMDNNRKQVHVKNGKSETASLTKEKTTTERYKAKSAKLDYEKKLGKLRDSDEVDAAIDEAAEIIIRAMEMLPSRADDLYSVAIGGDAGAMRAALKEVARDIRSLVSTNLRGALAKAQ